MKTKAKLLLAISTLSAVVLAAGVTSTFAWFTTKNEATLTYGSLSVDKLSSITLNVTDYSYQPSTLTGAIGGNDTAAVTDGRTPRSLGLVSSATGETFWAPTELNATGTYSTMAEVKGSWVEAPETPWNEANKYVGYIRYKIAVTAEKESTTHGLGIYFTHTTPVGTHIQSHYRVAVYETDEDWDKQTNTDANKIYSDTAISTAYKAYTGAGTKADVTTEALPTTPGTPNKLLPTFTSTSGSVTKYFVVALWIEGNNGADNTVGGDTINLVAHFALTNTFAS